MKYRILNVIYDIETIWYNFFILLQLLLLHYLVQDLFDSNCNINWSSMRFNNKVKYELAMQ